MGDFVIGMLIGVGLIYPVCKQICPHSACLAARAAIDGIAMTHVERMTACLIIVLLFCWLISLSIQWRKVRKNPANNQANSGLRVN